MDPHVHLYLILASLAFLAVACGSFALGRSRKRKAHLVRLASVPEKTGIAILTLDHDGVIEWVNEGFTGITGFRAADAVGKSPAGLLFASLQNSRLVQRFREGLSSGKNF